LVIEYKREPAKRYVAAKVAVGGTPWTIIGELSDAAALARPRALLQRLMVVALRLVASSFSHWHVRGGDRVNRWASK
jgi:hypothetical protein